MATDSNSEGSSASFALMMFIIITLAYFFIKYNSPSSGLRHTAIYYLAVIFTQYLVNLSALKQRCGKVNWSMAFTVTIIPWVLIFGLLNLMLTKYPGWKAPFSNTFGYMLAKLSGAKEVLLYQILKNTSELSIGKGKTAEDKKAFQSGLAILQNVYNEPATLINEVTPGTFDTFWERMKPLFNDGVAENTEIKNRFLKLIKLKDMVAEGIWYLLTGGLITSVSHTYIVTADCGLKAAEMKARFDEYEPPAPPTNETEYVETHADENEDVQGN